MIKMRDKLKTMGTLLSQLVENIEPPLQHGSVASSCKDKLESEIRNLEIEIQEHDMDIATLKDNIGYLNIYSEFKCCLIYLQLFIGIINLE
jgi:hypothetical protein